MADLLWAGERKIRAFEGGDFWVAGKTRVTPGARSCG